MNKIKTVLKTTLLICFVIIFTGIVYGEPVYEELKPTSHAEMEKQIEAFIDKHLNNRETDFSFIIYDFGFKDYEAYDDSEGYLCLIPDEPYFTTLYPIRKVLNTDKNDYLHNIINSRSLTPKYISDYDYKLTGFQVDYKISYYESVDETNKVKEYVKKELPEIIKGKSSQLEKIHAMYSYIYSKYDFDDDFSVFSPYMMLNTKKGTYSALTGLMYLFLKEAGIETRIIKSDIEVSVMDNYYYVSWNYVKLDDKWYHIDISGDKQQGVSKAYIKENHFLKCDNAMEYNHNWDKKFYPASSTENYTPIVKKGSASKEYILFNKLLDITLLPLLLYTFILCMVIAIIIISYKTQRRKVK